MMGDLGLYDKNSSQAIRPGEQQDLCTLSILSQVGCIVCVWPLCCEGHSKEGPWIW